MSDGYADVFMLLKNRCPFAGCMIGKYHDSTLRISFQNQGSGSISRTEDLYLEFLHDATVTVPVPKPCRTAYGHTPIYHPPRLCQGVILIITPATKYSHA
jgi:hypothetical protein